MRAIPVPLRKRIVELYERGKSTREIAQFAGFCVAAVRRGGGRLVGKTNLHELAYGTSGVNPWFGTPANPVDPGRVPGGSSSGSAVAVAVGECEVGIGSDTGGSNRIPAACCGVVGLKTTWGRVPAEGVWPLAPSFDSIGPIAANVAGVALGLALLEGRPAAEAPPVGQAGIGRARLGPAVEIDPVIEAAVDGALAASELPVTDVVLEGWLEAWRAHGCILDAEAWATDRELLESDPGGIGDDVRERLRAASRRTPEQVAAAEATRPGWTASMREAVGRHGVLALPTIPIRPPEVGATWVAGFNRLTSPVNFCGFPAVSLPVAMPADAETGWRTTGLQLVGLPGTEEQLLAVAAVLEEAAGFRP